MSAITGIVGSQQIDLSSSTGKIDPYAVFKLNFAALGGEEKVKNNNTTHLKGESTVGSTVYNYEEWNRKSTKSKKKYTYYSTTIFQSGDDGENLWVVKDNKLSSLPDDESPERIIRKGFEDYDYTDPSKRFFKIKSTKTSRIDGQKVYEINIRNTKTSEIRTQYYDAKDFMLIREVKDIDGSKTQIDYDKYQDVNGIKMAYKKTVTSLDTDVSEVFEFSEITRNTYISKEKFKVPETTASSSSSTTGTNVDTYA